MPFDFVSLLKKSKPKKKKKSLGKKVATEAKSAMQKRRDIEKALLRDL